jgi:hypothetical protein
MKETLSKLFLEDDQDQLREISLRAATRTGRIQKDEEDTAVEKRVKGWVKTTLGTAPWAAFAIVLFAVFAQGGIAGAALGYGLLKVAIAVIGTVIADETMFRGQRECKTAGWVPMIRRSIVFAGICWLMAVT